MEGVTDINGKQYGLVFAASIAACCICGCSNPTASQSSISQSPQTSSSQSSFGVQAASAASPEIAASVFDGDPRFEAPAKNGAAAPRTAWRQGYLVRAVVIESRPVEKSSARHNVLQVTHVYSGPQKLVGQTFRALSSSGIFNGVDMSWPELEIGEQNIWSLQKIDRAGRNSRWAAAREIEASGVWASRLPLPFTYGYSAVYSALATKGKSAQLLSAAEALAEKVERVERSAPAEQEKLLRSYALDANPDIYQWATETLTSWKPLGVAEFFQQQLDDKALPVQKQVFFDRALSDFKGKDWNRSSQRAQILERWANAKMTDSEAEAVQYWLFATIYQGTIEPEKGLALFKTSLLNAPTENWRGSAIYGLFGRLIKEGKLPRSHAFGFLLHQVEYTVEPSVKLAAATGFIGLLLSPTEASAIKAIQQRTENQQLKDSLQYTLDFSAKADESQRRRARNANAAR